MNKLFNYQKNGPGISKKSGNSQNVSGFWRIYRAKFFQLIGLNLIFCLFLLIALVIAWFPLNKVLDGDSGLSDNLKSDYAVDSSYTTVFNRIIDSYKIENSDVDNASVHFKNAVKTLYKYNPDALSVEMDNGFLVGFDNRKLSRTDLDYIGNELITGFEKLGFSVKITEDKNTSGLYNYALIDSAENQVAKVTYSVSKNGDPDVIKIAHKVPYSVGKVFLIVLCLAPLIILGPVSMGITKITRDYVRGEPTFMLSDLWDTVKKNWWQSLIISVIEYLTIGCAFISLFWYYVYINSGLFFIIGFAGCLFLSYIFISMNFYIPMMQVTLDLKLIKIYKNAFFFTVICMLKNVWMIIVTAVLFIAFGFLLVVGMGTPFIMPLVAFAILTMVFSSWFYFISYNTYPAVKKYVIDPYYESLNGDNSDDENNNKTEEADSDSFVINEKAEVSESEFPEYVYHNGRMVRRSLLEQESLFEDDVK